MSKKLFIGMCIGLLLAAALAQAHHIIIYKEQLPYSDAKTLNVSGSAGEVMSIYYGAWLSGPGHRSPA